MRDDVAHPFSVGQFLVYRDSFRGVDFDVRLAVVIVELKDLGTGSDEAKEMVSASPTATGWPAVTGFDDAGDAGCRSQHADTRVFDLAFVLSVGDDGTDDRDRIVANELKKGVDAVCGFGGPAASS